MIGVFVGGLVIGGILLGLALWLRDYKIKWYEWAIGVIGLLLVGVGVWHYFASLVERFSTAGWFGLLVLGIPGLVLLVLAWQLALRRNRAAA